MAACVIGNKIRKRDTFECGDGHKTLIVSCVGTAQDSDSIAKEISKANKAASIGAHAIADNSFYGNIDEYHRALTGGVNAYVAYVSNYEFTSRMRELKGGAACADPHLAIDVLREQVLRGLDILSVHASFLKRHMAMITESSRLIPTTSKGGGIISNYIRKTGKENPYYVYFDEILALFKEYNVTLSLGSTFRPATVCDTWDATLIEELTTMGELVERAYAAGVSVMIEGLGHSTIGNIPTHIKLAKELCHGAAYRMLPMATDIALGYDHISAAIAGAVGVASGANVITCVSRSEHIGLPSEEDVEEALIAGKVAVHCGEISLPNNDLEKDRQMSAMRWQKGCQGDWKMSIYPEGCIEALKRYGRYEDQHIQCSMCGKYCGIAAGIAAAKGSKTGV